MSKITQDLWDKLSSLIRDSSNIVLITHINSDGDGLGSQIAFYYYLHSIGKKCRIINPTPIPSNYKIINPDSIVEVYDENMNIWLSDVDLTIIFDIGDYRRIGAIATQVYGKNKSVSIDHHPSRSGAPFELDIVDCDAPATGYMVWKYF